jgi:hypothetical protein
VRAQPGAGLLGALVAAEGGQPPAAVGTAEAAHRHREAVQDRDRRVEADLLQDPPTQLGLDRPQIGSLTDKGGAVDAAKAGEPVAPVAAEVLVDALVGVDAQELADALDGQHLAVAERRLRAALTQPDPSQPLIDRAVDSAEQGRNIHG